MQTRRVLIVGQSGTGKTTLARQLVAPARCPRLLALDPVPDLDGGWATTCEVAESWEEIKAAARRPTFRVVSQEELYSVEQAQEQLDVAVRIARAPEVGRCVLVVDELSVYFRKGREAPDSIQGLVRFGRRQGVSCLLISQRAYDCPVEVRSQLTDLFVFRLVERDIEHLSQFIGRRNVEEVVDLPRFSFVHFDLTKSVNGSKRGLNEHRDQDDGRAGRHLLGRGSRALDSGQPAEEAGGRLTGDDGEEEEST